MIVGEEGVVMDDAEGQFWLYKHGERIMIERDLPDTTIAEAFVAAVLDGQENLSPAYQGANLVDVVEAIYRSAAERRIVSIEPGPQS